MDPKVHFHLSYLATDPRHAINMNRYVHITNGVGGPYGINLSCGILMNEDKGYSAKDTGFISQAEIWIVV